MSLIVPYSVTPIKTNSKATRGSPRNTAETQEEDITLFVNEQQQQDRRTISEG